MSFTAQVFFSQNKIVSDGPIAEEMPIGTLEAHLKSYTNTPAYSNKWVECNGQTLSDAESPYNGQVIPNLNASGGGTKRFLRGSTTSGTTGGADTNTHSHSSSISAVSFDGAGNFTTAIKTNVQNQTINILPPYYEVVWLLKIK